MKLSDQELSVLLISANMFMAAMAAGDVPYNREEYVVWVLVSSVISSLLYCSLTGSEHMNVPESFVEKEELIIKTLKSLVASAKSVTDREQAKMMLDVVLSLYQPLHKLTSEKN